jgi:hypothetical protein
MDDCPITCFADAGKSLASGLFSFYVGLVGGAIMVQPEWAVVSEQWFWCLFAWAGYIPYTMARLWGLILVPFLAVIFFGLIWRDWNRLVGACSVAIALATAMFLADKRNLFEDVESGLKERANRPQSLLKELST